MVYQNPYAHGPEPAPGHEEVVTARMLRVMSAAQGWVIMFGLLLGVFLLSTLGTVGYHYSTLASYGESWKIGTLVGAGALLVTCGVTILLLLVHLIRVNAFVNAGRAFELLDVARWERVFWMIASILAIVWIVLLAIVAGLWLQNVNAGDEEAAALLHGLAPAWQPLLEMAGQAFVTLAHTLVV